MNPFRVDFRGRSKVPKGRRIICWLVGGTTTSLVVAYVGFFILVFALGPGIDIDDEGTRFQQLLSSVARPVHGLIFVGGVYSILRPASCWRGKEDGEKA